MEYKNMIKILVLIFSVLALYVYATKSFTSIGSAILLFSISFLGVLPILLFQKREVIHSWGILTAWWIPLSFILISAAPEYYSGIVGFDKKLTALWMAGIFFVVSLIIIAYKSYKLRGK